MRVIRKQGNANHRLMNLHANPPLDAEQARARWRSFNGQHKERLLQALLNEQYQLCCYSELRADIFNLGYHIEHVDNKSQYPQKTFDYGNLAACSFSSEKLQEWSGRGDVVFGGHYQLKQKLVNKQLFISPHQPDCHRFFAYISDGRVVAAANLSDADKCCAEYTINLLNLNSNYLVMERRKWSSELFILLEEHETKGWDLDYLAYIYLIPCGQSLESFFSLARQFFGAIGERTLLQYAPQLQ